jgi:hypothetical protein
MAILLPIADRGFFVKLAIITILAHLNCRENFLKPAGIYRLIENMHISERNNKYIH